MSSTTFVSCLFDCHEGTDYKAKNYYFARCMRNMYIDEPMVIFCDPHYVQKILGIRTALGYHQTKVVPMTVKDLQLYALKDSIKCREGRLTKDMIIVWNSKSELLLSVLKSNPFNTTHFAWIDINFLSKHPNESINYFLPDAYDTIHKIAINPHDKMAIMLLNAWAPSEYNNLDNYYIKYNFTVAGAFFTMDLETGLFLLPKMIELTEDHAKLGVLWSDEHIYAIIIDKYEDKFTLLLGDYQDNLTNYFSLETNHKHINEILINNHRGHGLHDRIIRILKEYQARDTVKTFDYDETIKKYFSG